MKIKTNFLKNIIDWIRDVLESSDTSTVLLVLIFLPIIVPIVPSYITANNLFTQMKLPLLVAWVGGIGVELLGFSAAILLLKSVTEWINSKNEKQMFAMLTNVIAYLFYLGTIISVNVVLDIQAGRPFGYVLVVALLCAMSIPSGMLSAGRLMAKDEQSLRDDERRNKEAETQRIAEENALIRKEQNEFKLKSKALKAGINVFQSQTIMPQIETPVSNNQGTHQTKIKYGSDYRDKVIVMLEEVWNAENRVLSPSEITERVNKKYKTEFVNGNVKGFWSRLTSDWKAEKGIN